MERCIHAHERFFSVFVITMLKKSKSKVKSEASSRDNLLRSTSNLLFFFTPTLLVIGLSY